MANNLGERIKLARKKAGITQEELARKLGIAYPTLNKYERGHRTPDSAILNQMANLLKCDPGWLLAGNAQVYESVSVKISATPVFNNVPDLLAEQVSEDTVEYIRLPDVPSNAYALVVKGDSMLPTVRDGDYAIFIHDPDIKSGDIIILNNEWGESMLRRYQKKEKKEFFISDNPEYPALSLKHKPRVIGKVIAVWRKIRI